LVYAPYGSGFGYGISYFYLINRLGNSFKLCAASFYIITLTADIALSHYLGIIIVASFNIEMIATL